VNGWVASPIANSIPPRYTGAAHQAGETILPSSAPSRRQSVDAPSNRSSVGMKLEDHAVQDVHKEVQLFDDFMSTKLRPTFALGAPLNHIAETSNQGTSLAEVDENQNLSITRSTHAPQSFFGVLDQNRQESGLSSVSSRIGSRRVSYVLALDASDDSDSEEPEEKKRSTVVKISPESPALETLSAFKSWMKFCGLSRSYFAFLVFLYILFPAPRLWYDQWIGFWVAKTYSTDDQFNINILVVSFAGVILLRTVPDLMAFNLAALSERNMRKAICKTVANAPMTFFMTENLGPLIGVFSRDLAIIGDELMQDSHMGLLYIIFNLASTVFVCVRFVYFIIPGVIVFTLLFFVQRAYSQKMIVIREEFQQAQDDLYRILYDNLEGIQILRSARAEQWALDLLGETFANNRIAIVAVERTNIWLAQRADALAVL
jgi:ABC-type multidrug transport system fused ATPase/permease subunit